jgi:hypothetical protein
MPFLGGNPRPQPPLSWPGLGPGQARHHVIPFSRLAALWDAILRVARTPRPEATPAVRQFICLCGMATADVDHHMNALRAGTLSVPIRDNFRRFAAWPAWNCVYGPQCRADDPHDHYFDRFRVGLTAGELHRMEALERFYNRTSALNLNGLVDVATLRLIQSECVIARAAMQGCIQPIPFRGDQMWEAAGNNLWRKRRA